MADETTQTELAGRTLSGKTRAALRSAWQAIGDVIKHADGREMGESDAPDYRMATSGKSCANCAYFQGGSCTQYEFKAKGEWVCDDHEAREEQAEMATALAEALKLGESYEIVSKEIEQFAAELTAKNAPPFLLVDLSSTILTPGKPFDGMVFGSFVDMYGREVKLDPKDKAAYIANTKRAIEATRGESGELAGLPIDAKNHDKGDAAGWIVDVMDGGGDLIRFLANWTEIGAELIGKGIRRFFSPTINTAGKVILGGSLANWIASTDSTGVVKLRPVELAQGVHTFQVNQPAGDSPAVNLSKGATMNLNELTADERTALLAQARQTVLAEIAPGSNGGAAEDTIAQLREQLKVTAFADVADLSTAREEMLTQMELALKAEYQRMQKNAGSMLAEMMAGIKREQHIAEFAARVTGGTDKRPHGLPVGREEIETFLGQLNDNQRQAAESIIGRTWEHGMVSFSELGHGKDVPGGLDLPEYIAKDLDSGELTVKELSNPILGLGDLSRYNLSRWQGGK